MRELVVLTFVSLDGIMQAPGGEGEDPSGGFDLEGWTVPYFDEVVGNEMTKQMGQPFDLLLGRKTYEIFASYWPHPHLQVKRNLCFAPTETVAAIDGENVSLHPGCAVRQIVIHVCSGVLKTAWALVTVMHILV